MPVIAHETETLIYKDAPIECKDADGGRTITFIASHERVDASSEVVLVDNISEARFALNPVLLRLHNNQESAVGVVRRLWRTMIAGAKALMGEAVFPDRPQSDAALADVRAGLLNGVSIGFRSLEQGPPVLPGQRGITHVKTLLVEISLVTLPACETCRVLQVKCACASGWTPASAGRAAAAAFAHQWREKYGAPQNETRRQWKQIVAYSKRGGAPANEREQRHDHSDVFESYGLQVRRRDAGLCWACGRLNPKGVVLELEEVPTMLELEEEFFEVDAEQVTKATRAAWDRGVHAAVAQAVQQAIDYARGRVH